METSAGTMIGRPHPQNADRTGKGGRDEGAPRATEPPRNPGRLARRSAGGGRYGEAAPGAHRRRGGLRRVGGIGLPASEAGYLHEGLRLGVDKRQAIRDILAAGIAAASPAIHGDRATARFDVATFHAAGPYIHYEAHQIARIGNERGTPLTPRRLERRTRRGVPHLVDLDHESRLCRLRSRCGVQPHAEGLSPHSTGSGLLVDGDGVTASPHLDRNQFKGRASVDGDLEYISLRDRRGSLAVFLDDGNGHLEQARCRDLLRIEGEDARQNYGEKPEHRSCPESNHASSLEICDPLACTCQDLAMMVPAEG